MPREIVSWLSAQTAALPDIRFVNEYPPLPKPTPLKRKTVAVGLEKVKISDKFTENDQGEAVREEYCRLAELKIRFTVYVPYSEGGRACHEVFNRVVDCLSFNSDLNIISTSCESVYADRDTDAFVLPSRMELKADFCPAEGSEIQYQAFLPKTFFCRSHLNDGTIHVTQQDKDRWNAPMVSGSYVGTDGTSRNVSLGFTPSFVIAFASGLPPVCAGDGGLDCMFAFAGASYSSGGLSITDTGFEITMSEETSVGSTRIRLNSAGTIYSWTAWK